MEVNISHPIIVFSFCDINADCDGLKFSCNKYSNVFTVFTISNIPSWRKMFSTFLLKQVNSFLADKNTYVILCVLIIIIVIIIIIEII